MSALLLHPKQSELNTERAVKRAELVDLLFRLEHMRLQSKPYLRALYRQHFGVLELQLLQAKRQTAQLRANCSSDAESNPAQLSLVPAADSKAVPTDPTQRYLRAQSRHSQRLKSAAQYFAALSASASDSEELRRLFKNIVRLIHPALVAESDQSLFAEQWRAAKSAYRAADLAQLEDIAGQIVHQRVGRKRKLAAASLRAEIQMLDKALAKYQHEYDRLMQLRVFKQAKLLLDPAWRRQRQGFLERGIAQQQQTQKIYQQLMSQRAELKKSLRRASKPSRVAAVAAIRPRASNRGLQQRHAKIPSSASLSSAGVARGKAMLPLSIPFHQAPAR